MKNMIEDFAWKVKLLLLKGYVSECRKEWKKHFLPISEYQTSKETNRPTILFVPVLHKLKAADWFLDGRRPADSYSEVSNWLISYVKIKNSFCRLCTITIPTEGRNSFFRPTKKYSESKELSIEPVLRTVQLEFWVIVTFWKPLPVVFHSIQHNFGLSGLRRQRNNNEFSLELPCHVKSSKLSPFCRNRTIYSWRKWISAINKIRRLWSFRKFGVKTIWKLFRKIETFQEFELKRFKFWGGKLWYGGQGNYLLVSRENLGKRVERKNLQFGCLPELEQSM